MTFTAYLYTGLAYRSCLLAEEKTDDIEWLLEEINFYDSFKHIEESDLAEIKVDERKEFYDSNRSSRIVITRHN